MTEPKIINAEETKAAGYTFNTRLTEFRYRTASSFWLNCKFDQITQQEYSLFADNSPGEIGIFRKSDNVSTLTYFYGSIVKNYDLVCDKASKITIPGGLYAVFSTEKFNMCKQGSNELITRVRNLWKEINEHWIIENPKYTLDSHRDSYEFYGSSSANNDNISMDIFIPVKEKQS